MECQERLNVLEKILSGAGEEVGKWGRRCRGRGLTRQPEGGARTKPWGGTTTAG